MTSFSSLLISLHFLLNGDTLGTVTGAVARRGRVQVRLSPDAPDGRRLRRRPRGIVERRGRHDCPPRLATAFLRTTANRWWSESARDLSPFTKKSPVIASSGATVIAAPCLGRIGGGEWEKRKRTLRCRCVPSKRSSLGCENVRCYVSTKYGIKESNSQP